MSISNKERAHFSTKCERYKKMKKWNTNIKTSKNRKIRKVKWKVRIDKKIKLVRVYNMDITLDEMLSWFEKF